MKRKILGLIEPITVKGKTKEIKVNAKVDTGASKSSISKELVKKLGIGKVRRIAVFKSALGRQKRKVVKTSIVLKGKKLKVFFSVADRKHMKYNLLIGRNILRMGKFLIDPLKK